MRRRKNQLKQSENKTSAKALPLTSFAAFAVCSVVLQIQFVFRLRKGVCGVNGCIISLARNDRVLCGIYLMPMREGRIRPATCDW
jgi:hypothetical protein